MNALADKIYRTMRKTGILDLIPDEPYLKLMYRLKMGKPLDLKNPKTYTEKLQWLKLYNRKPEYTRMVDKYEAKSYIAEKVGSDYVIPTLGVWDNFEDIDFSLLPDRFVLKTTHDSGGVYICRGRESFDYSAAKEKIEKSLSRSYYSLYREWPYKNVKPRILAEEYLEDTTGHDPRDYKFHTYHGVPKILVVISDRQTGFTKADYFDIDYNPIPMGQTYPHADTLPPKPKCFEQMKALVCKIADGIPYIRVDLYEVAGKIYVGELTFFPDSGLAPFNPSSRDELYGSWIVLPQKKK